MNLKRRVMLLFVGFLFFLPIIMAVDLSITNTEVMEGELVEVQIKINTEESVYGGQFDLNYDPNIIEFQSIRPGGFFSDKGKVLDSNDLGSIQVESGKLNDYYILRGVGERGGVSGTGVLAIAKFKGKTVGSSKISLTEVVLGNPDANNIEIDSGIKDGNIKVVKGALSGFNLIGIIILGVIVLIIVIVWVVLKRR